MIAIMFGLFRYLMNSPWHRAPSSVISCKELLLSLGSQWAWRRTVYADDHHRICQFVVSYSLAVYDLELGRINTQLSVTSNVLWHENGEITINISWPPRPHHVHIRWCFQIKNKSVFISKFPMTQLFVYCILAFSWWLGRGWLWLEIWVSLTADHQ